MKINLIEVFQLALTHAACPPLQEEAKGWRWRRPETGRRRWRWRQKGRGKGGWGQGCWSSWSSGCTLQHGEPCWKTTPSFVTMLFSPLTLWIWETWYHSTKKLETLAGSLEERICHEGAKPACATDLMDLRPCYLMKHHLSWILFFTGLQNNNSWYPS